MQVNPTSNNDSDRLLRENTRRLYKVLTNTHIFVLGIVQYMII